MLKVKHGYAALGVLLTLSVCGCVTLPPNSPRSPQDPWESWNRGVYKVNTALDKAVAKPVARTYVRVLPSPVRTGVSNFFENLRTPTVMINDVLQGKFKAAANDLARFLLNTTVGVGGLLDPATQAGLDLNDEDFGQTLGHWGVHPGPFVEIPLLGPSDVRDGTGRVVDIFTGPTHYVRNNYVKYSLYGLSLIDTRAALLSLDDTLKKVFDPYAFLRDAYLQHRAYLVSDGKLTDEPLVDPGADDAPPPPSSPPTPPSPPPSPSPSSPTANTAETAEQRKTVDPATASPATEAPAVDAEAIDPLS
jgi:phospholipid-binding lipoprotein MlaA